MTPTVSPGVTALQILGIPVNAFPPDVVAAISPTTNTGGGTETGGGTNTGGGTETGGGTDGGGTTGGGTTGGGTHRRRRRTPAAAAPPAAATNRRRHHAGGGTTAAAHTGGGTGGGTTDPDIPTTSAFCGPARDSSDALDSVGASENRVSSSRPSGGRGAPSPPPSPRLPSALSGDVDTSPAASASSSTTWRRSTTTALASGRARLRP